MDKDREKENEEQHPQTRRALPPTPPRISQNDLASSAAAIECLAHDNTADVGDDGRDDDEKLTRADSPFGNQSDHNECEPLVEEPEDSYSELPAFLPQGSGLQVALRSRAGDGGVSLAQPKAMWRKREVVRQERTVQYTTIDADGSKQVRIANC
jgi:hypothetical protein